MRPTIRSSIAIRNGKRPDARPSDSPCRLNTIDNMSDREVRGESVFAHIKPIKNKIEKSTFKNSEGLVRPTVTGRARMAEHRQSRHPSIPRDGRGIEWTAHTVVQWRSTDQSRRRRKGVRGEARGGRISSTNLTPANDAGIAGWSMRQVSRDAIAQGARPDRGNVPLMAFEWYKNISAGRPRRCGWPTCGH